MAMASALEGQTLTAYSTEMHLHDSMTGLKAEVRDFMLYINVYHENNRIAGVITRPTWRERMVGNYEWSITLPDGTKLKSVIGPRSGFAALRKHYRQMEQGA